MPHRLPFLLLLFLSTLSALPSQSSAGIVPVARERITDHGISWTFDRPYEVGRFANGDWWVVGPVKIIEIDPPSRTASRIINGSMVNPGPWSRHGYDSSMRYNQFDKSLNAALDVSRSKPLSVKVNSSLVSTKSVSAPGNRPQIQSAQVLTVLPAPAKPGDFRPAYCGDDKRIRFNESQLNYSLLGKLKPTSSVPSLATVERYFERPWLDHMPRWTGTEGHVVDNMPHYGRNMSNRVGIGALMLNVDFTNAQKRTLLVRYVQLGIDLMGIVDAGGLNNWINAGGHASGRKWPILFAGIVLNDPVMKGIGDRKDVAFGEDQQTWIVTQADVGRNLTPNPSTAKILYKQSHVGMPEWGIEHATRPIRDNANWKTAYRQCCTANAWNGFVLAAWVMDAKKLWKHDPLFDYMDRYIAECRRLNNPSYMVSWDGWTIQMWDEYRELYGPQIKLEARSRPASAFHEPLGVQSKATPDIEVRLSWKSFAGAHSFEIHRGSLGNATSRIDRNITDLFYTDPSVDGSKAWVYAVVAVNQNGIEIARSKNVMFR